MKVFPALLLGFCVAVVPQVARPVEADWGLKLKLGGLVEGERDLGLSATPVESTEVGYLDAYGSVLLRFSPDFATYARVQGYLPSGDVYQEEDNRTVRAKGYGALREAWMEYGGLTTYPGEVVRLGLQRVRDPDGLWWDRDIESLRWIFDTTLLQWHVGVAQQFDNYRTDDVELSLSQENRAYFLAGLGGQWQPGNFVGLRGSYAADRSDDDDFTPSGATTLDSSRKNRERNYSWVGLNLHNGYYDYEAPPAFAYWVEGVMLTGSSEFARIDDSNPLAPRVVRDEEDVRAFGGDVGLRVRMSSAPLQIGAAYAYGQGNSGSGDNETFEQTGLQSNRSRFTGTRSTLYRFNEALQADLTNLHVATAYFSVPTPRFDMSVVYHRFERDDEFAAIETDGIDVDPVNSSSDIGRGYDLVMAYYFGEQGSGYGWGDDLRNNVRLRGSLFQPGKAYGAAAEDQHRAVFEVTLWF